MEEILQLIEDYWKFDNNQQPVSNWHDKQDLKEKVRKIINRYTSGKRNFHLSEKEEKLFDESKSKRIMFELGGGIGYGVLYQAKNGKWVDITDYECW